MTPMLSATAQLNTDYFEGFLQLSRAHEWLVLSSCLIMERKRNTIRVQKWMAWKTYFKKTNRLNFLRPNFCYWNHASNLLCAQVCLKRPHKNSRENATHWKKIQYKFYRHILTIMVDQVRLPRVSTHSQTNEATSSTERRNDSRTFSLTILSQIPPQNYRCNVFWMHCNQSFRGQ